MKILHVITGMRKAAGTSVFVGELSREQISQRHRVTIVHREIWRLDNYNLDSDIEFVSEKEFLRACSKQAYDIVHIHGLWEPMLHRFAKYARMRHIKIVWSPHGGLTKWAMRNRWWKKLPVWYFYQKIDLQYAAAIHVTAQSEVVDARRLGLENKIILAPLGVEICEKKNRLYTSGNGNIFCEPNFMGKVGDDIFSSMDKDCRKKTITFIGRVHPIKNLATLLRAFNCVSRHQEQMFKQWTLRIVGPDQNGHTAELKALAKNLGIEDSVDFSGPKYDDELKAEYRNADCFVLPSHSENFGSVVIESLASGVPVITTKGTPWQELEEWGCGKWVDISEEAIEKALVEMMQKTDAERQEMGQKGVELVQKKYSWAAVCDRVIKGYEEVLKEGDSK